MGNPIGVSWLGDDATVHAGCRDTTCDGIYTYILMALLRLMSISINNSNNIRSHQSSLLLH